MTLHVRFYNGNPLTTELQFIWSDCILFTSSGLVKDEGSHKHDTFSKWTCGKKDICFFFQSISVCVSSSPPTYPAALQVCRPSAVGWASWQFSFTAVLIWTFLHWRNLRHQVSPFMAALNRTPTQTSRRSALRSATAKLGLKWYTVNATYGKNYKQCRDYT